jgi:hypothetical protein
MYRTRAHVPWSTTATPLAIGTAAIALLTAGCVGRVGDREGSGGSGAGPDSGGTVGGGSPGTGGTAPPPALVEIAARYFPGTVATDAPARVVRLSRLQLDSTTRTLLPGVAVPSALTTLPRDPLQTNYEYADNLGFNGANFTPFTTWVASVAAAVKATPERVVNCAGSATSSTCLADQARKFVRTAFRGTASDAQLTHYADFFTTSVAAVGLPAAVADLVDVTLTSPGYAFRDEVLTDAGVLRPAQRLQHITYTLADAPPATLGLSSLTPDTHVGNAPATAATIDQVLASPQARGKLLRFFLAWLEVKEPEEFTIASSAFPEFTPAVAEAVVAETRAFLERQLGQATPTLKDVTESTQSVVSGAEAFLYGISPSAAAGVVELDPTRRLGIFTQPAVLASHSGPTTSRLVKRGVFFVRKVMCMPLGMPPAGVDLTVPPSAGATERQRIEAVTAQTSCQGCHGVINPFGFMQENYDAIGRWRTTDEGAPIDASISVAFLDEGPLATSSPVEALRAFTRSRRFQQCFARQVFRYYMGRDEGPGDDPVLRQMFLGFASGDRLELAALLRALAGAPSFSRRAEVP